MTIDDIAVQDYLWVDDPAGGRTIMVQAQPGEWVGPRDLTSDHQGILDGRPELVPRPEPTPNLHDARYPEETDR